jgi:hypothetical protein
MYKFNGYDLEPRVYGKIHGGIFIGEGDKSGVDNTPYDISYNVPNGTNIMYAILYTYIWGGDEYNTGTIQIEVNNKELEEIDLGGTDDENEDVLISTHGCFSIFFVVTDEIILNKKNNITIHTWGESLDGRVYGAILLVIYEIPTQIIEFCFVDGNEGLHYLIKGSSYDSCSMKFPDINNNNNEFKTTDLWISTVAGDGSEDDYLYFNDNIIDTNYADESSGDSFDFDEFNLTGDLESTNEIKINRGEESYLHPMNVLLISKYKSGFGNDTADYIKFEERKFSDSDETSLFDDPEFINLLLVIIASSTFVLLIGFQILRKKKHKKADLETSEEDPSKTDIIISKKEGNLEKFENEDYFKETFEKQKELKEKTA